MACPTGKFAEMVKTPSGLTPDEPYNLIPNYIAYGDWLGQAMSVLARARRELKQYTEIKPAESWTAEETATWTTLGNEFDTLVDRYNDLPHPWDLLDTSFPGELIGKAVNLTTDIACLWERISNEILSIGGKPIDPPGPLPKSMSLLEKTLTIGGILGGGALLIYGVRTFQNRKGAA